MRKALVITLFILAAFIVEFLLFNCIGAWVVPNLLLLLVIFFNLYFGIRYGLFTALVAGTVKDSFSTGVFGMHVCTFIVCAYMTTALKRYIYHMGSGLSRYILIFLIYVINVLVYYTLYQSFVGVIPPGWVLLHVFLPEAMVTMVAAPFAFEYLKTCVSRLFV